MQPNQGKLKAEEEQVELSQEEVEARSGEGE